MLRESRWVGIPSTSARPSATSTGPTPPNIWEGAYEAEARDCAVQTFLGLEDPHEARARELEAIGWDRWAWQIRHCVRLEDRGGPIPFGWIICHKRFCPSCSTVRAEARRQQILGAISRMATPTVVLFNLDWRPLDELPRALAELRRCLTKVRKGPLRGVSMIGTIEPHLQRPSFLWNVHGHAVIDATLDLLERKQVAKYWATLTKGLGKFGPEPGRERLQNRFGVAEYLSKSEDTCPAPGSMRRRHLEVLLTAIHREDLTISLRRTRRPERHKRARQFSLYAEQIDVIDEAIVHAALVISNGTVGLQGTVLSKQEQSKALAFIAADYVLYEVATTWEARRRALAVIEECMGLKLVAIHDGSIVHGEATSKAFRAEEVWA